MSNNYIKIADRRTLYVDCDETLIKWTSDSKNDIPIDCTHRVVYAHQEHIKKIKQFKVSGYIIVVWSGSGADWAEQVVRMLGIEDIVDVIISKPTFFMDDLPSSLFMPESSRIWKEDKEVIKTIQPVNSW